MDYSLNQNNQNQQPKHISTWVGLVIIIIITGILFGGIFAYQYFATKSQQNSEFFASRQKTDQTQSQIQNTETAGWKTYKNDEYGFEVKYPKSWIINDDKNYAPIIKFCDSEYKTEQNCGLAGKGDTPAITIRNDSLDIYVSSFCSNNPDNIFCSENLDKTTINIDGRAGSLIKFKDINGGSIFTLWKKNDQDKSMFEFQVSGLKTAPNYKEVFSNMLSTFKFDDFINTTKQSQILSFDIIPSQKNVDGIIYEKDAKAVVIGKNLTKVEFYQRGGGQIYLSAKGSLIGAGRKIGDNKWELSSLPEGRLMREFCAVGFGESNKEAGEVCLFNVLGK